MSEEPPPKLSKLDLFIEEDFPRSVKCQICCLPHSTETCPLLNTGVSIPDTKLSTRAIQTLPENLSYKKYKNGSHEIITKIDFLKGTTFGPVVAPKVKHLNRNCLYTLQVCEGETNYFLDTSDENNCNWMILVPFNDDITQRNCICYQLNSEVYFTTIKDIPSGHSLTVDYSPGYKTFLKEQERRNSHLVQVESVSLINSNSLRSTSDCTDCSKNVDCEEVFSTETERQSDDRDREESSRVPSSADFPEDEESTSGLYSTCTLDIDVDGFTISPDLSSTSGEDIGEVNMFLDGINDEDEAGYSSDFNSETSDIGDKRISKADTQGEISSSAAAVQKKLQRLTNRAGPVLALDEWKCKFCAQVLGRIFDFVTHLIRHYKSVGAAKTEKMRLQKSKTNMGLKLEILQARNVVESPLNQSIKSTSNSLDVYEPQAKDQVTRNNIDNNFESSPGEDLHSSDTNNSIIKPGPTSLEPHSNGASPQYPYICDLCVNKRVFNRAEYIIRHLTKHARVNYCYLCKKVFSERDDLKCHSCTGVLDKPLTSEGKRVNHCCQFCRNTFKTLDGLHSHVKSTHLGESCHKCKNCSKLFASPDLYKNHGCNNATKNSIIPPPTKSTATPEDEVIVMYKCEICNDTFPRLLVLQNHLKTHGYTFACSICNKSLTHSAFKTHMAICEVVQGFSSNSTDVLKCPKCTEIFDDLDLFRCHIVKHTHPSMCPSCNQRLPCMRPTGLRFHKCSNFQCDGCDDVLTTLIDYKKHIVSVHEGADYFCFECALPFVTEEGYNGHKNCEVKKRLRPKFQESLFICEVCGLTYSKWAALKTHRYTHLERKYACEICQKTFLRRETLNGHLLGHKEAQFECQVCRKKFKSRKSLEVHRGTHQAIKKFPCKDCDKSYAQKINLTAHQTTHLPPDEQGFPCKYCKKKFASKEYLGCHVEVHEKGKQQVCQLCSKTFVTNHMLQSHMKHAHGNQQYSCEFCQNVVRKKHSLSRHLKSRHVELESTWIAEGYLDSRVVVIETSDARKCQTDGQEISCVSEGTPTETSDSSIRRKTRSGKRKTEDSQVLQSKEIETELEIEVSTNEDPTTMVYVEVEGEEFIITLEDSQVEVLEGSNS